MQTKKRAKPVKFNLKDSPSKTEEPDGKKEKADLTEKIQEEKVTSKTLEKKPTDESKEIQEPHLTNKEDELEAREDQPSEDEKPQKEGKDEENAVSLDESNDQEEIDPKESQEEDQVEAVNESPLEKDRAFFNMPPDGYENKKGNLPYFLKVMIITFVVALGLFAGIYYFVTNKTINLIPNFKNNTEATATPTKEVPTLQPVNLADYTLQVLNGTSISGTAAKVKTSLEGEGFKVLSIGNADKDDYTLTEISAKKKVDPRFVDKLKEVLSKTYKIGAVSELASGEADVIIKIGSSSAK